MQPIPDKNRAGKENQGKPSIKCFGRLWITKGSTHFLGRNRIALLEKIDEKGSINTAAKAMNISYKRAWEIVNTIKKVSGQEVLECKSGGRGGGGSALTEHGKKLVRLYRYLEQKQHMLTEGMSAEAEAALTDPDWTIEPKTE
ncbi:MAG: LysR family transcriptional regulator [Dissulfurispiraceae bacterium]|jgi:molybdate transport system regulatory protein|nr:LysR family transcriptional regulator [Dissulfurispiraceae bacterium]